MTGICAKQAEPCDQCNGSGYMVSDGEYDGKCHCGAHFMDKGAAAAPVAPAAEPLRAALTALLTRYGNLAGSGDAGIWDWEAEPEVVAARAALATAPVAEAAPTTPVVELTDNQIYDFWLFRDCIEAIQAGDMKAQFVAAVRALLAKPYEVFPMLPMETAPTDGREVLLFVRQRAGTPRSFVVGHFMDGGHCIEDHPPIDRGWYFYNGYQFDRAQEPLAWMPLPRATTQDKETQK